MHIFYRNKYESVIALIDYYGIILIIMKDPALPKAHWSVVLANESSRPFESLVAAHDALSLSPDSFMQYASAWALLYASQKTHADAQEAFDKAITTLEHIEQEPVTKVYEWTADDIPLRASFARTLSRQIRHPKAILSIDERTKIFQSFEPLLERGISDCENGSTDARGMLGEIAIAALCWRPTPAVFSIFNVVPAGPMKDSRIKHKTQFATDLYAYHPTLKSTKKGRVNVQVKATLTDRGAKRYDKEAIVPIGLNEITHPIESVNDDCGKDKVLWLARTLQSDIAGEPLDLHEEEILLYGIADLYDRVSALAEDKLERLITKRRAT
ncbi:MAG: hypothetical protein QG628_246 [Patescibacteria group bacterium]|nr:hypothetical protein [Patescibacteria group bacterium]